MKKKSILGKNMFSEKNLERALLYRRIAQENLHRVYMSGDRKCTQTTGKWVCTTTSDSDTRQKQLSSRGKI